MRSLILLLLAVFAVPAFAAPTAPGNVVAVATSGTSVTVTWTESTGATGYRVLRNGVEPGSATTNLTFTDTGLTPGTAYSYTVVAVDSSGGTAQSVSNTVTTLSTPAIPTGLAGSATDAGVVLTWNTVVGATGYVIFRNGTEIDTSTGRTYTDEDVDPATTYRYSVASTNAAGDSDDTAEITITTKGDGSQREAVWTREFKRADGNFDGVVTFQEYLVAFPNTLPWVVMTHRFNSTDDDVSGDLTVDEYIAHFAGKTVKRPSKAQTFFIADLDGDNRLDPDEYALTLNRGTKSSVLMKKFSKLDKNDSTLVSQREFGIRYGTEE
jgi:hypothetical protein